MPVTKTAKRALRVSGRKQTTNSKIRSAFEAAIRVAQKSPTKANITKAYSAIDTASKKNLIHKNRAARLKSQISSKK